MIKVNVNADPTLSLLNWKLLYSLVRRCRSEHFFLYHVEYELELGVCMSGFEHG